MTGRANEFRTLRAEYADRHEIGDHDHAWGQLVYAAAGAIHVATPTDTWLIPAARAVWLPPLASHRLRMRGRTSLRTIYVPPDHCADLRATAHGLIVTALLRELILALTRYGYVDLSHPLQGALAGAVLATLAAAEPLNLVLTRPRDATALKVALDIEADPSRDVPLARLAAEHGTSLRTLQRRFVVETGVPLSEWRRGARLMAAAACLLDGESVTSVALDAGYSSTSAFIGAFRVHFGVSPGRFRAAGSS